MKNEYSIFQSFGDGNPSATFLSRAISSSIAKGFSVRFIRTNGGYTYNRCFYTNADTTHLQQYSIEDLEKNQQVTFTRIICDCIKGYVIDYLQIIPNNKNVKQ